MLSIHSQYFQFQINIYTILAFNSNISIFSSLKKNRGWDFQVLCRGIVENRGCLKRMINAPIKRFRDPTRTMGCLKPTFLLYYLFVTNSYYEISNFGATFDTKINNIFNICLLLRIYYKTIFIKYHLYYTSSK